jgi:hypothetical protein
MRAECQSTLHLHAYGTYYYGHAVQGELCAKCPKSWWSSNYATLG